MIVQNGHLVTQLAIFVAWYWRAFRQTISYNFYCPGQTRNAIIEVGARRKVEMFSRWDSDDSKQIRSETARRVNLTEPDRPRDGLNRGRPGLSRRGFKAVLLLRSLRFSRENLGREDWKSPRNRTAHRRPRARETRHTSSRQNEQKERKKRSLRDRRDRRTRIGFRQQLVATEIRRRRDRCNISRKGEGQVLRSD